MISKKWEIFRALILGLIIEMCLYLFVRFDTVSLFYCVEVDTIHLGRLL